MFMSVMMAVAVGMVVLVLMIVSMPADLHLAYAESASAVFAHKFVFVAADVSPHSVRRCPDLKFGVPRLRGSGPPEGGTPNEPGHNSL